MNKCHLCFLLLSAGLLSDDQQLAAVKEVVARLESRSHSLKMAALKLLEQLGRMVPTHLCLSRSLTSLLIMLYVGVGGREVILAILPLLMDPNVSSLATSIQEHSV